MKLVARMNSLAAMDVAYKNVGYAIMMMIVVMVPMRKIVPKCHVMLMNSPVQMVPVYTKNGNVMEIQIVMMDPMNL